MALALLLIIFLSYFWVAWAASEFRFGKVGTKGEWFLPYFWICCGVSLPVISYFFRRPVDGWQNAVSLFGVSIGLLTSLALATACPIEAARRSQCKNNLKQIGLALHNYHDRYETFPAQSEGDPAVSWRVAVLPYMDQAPLYNEYDKSLAWNAGTNEVVAKTYIREWTCPTTPPELRSGDYPYTAYVVPYGANTSWAPNQQIRFEDIT
ncbi:MAG: DUF1559 domain-containing protein, partial [Planctomycetaceae bacterium]|nr:DUF1559 domain-containing protein [Planctomycetaceae bacterium]